MNMFELLEKQMSKPMPRRVAVLGTVIGAFGLGLASGKLLAGAKPFDWTLEIMNVFFALAWTIWCAVVAARRDTAAGN